MSQSANVDKLIDMAQSLVDIQTQKPSLKEKLKSRKFWLAVALMVAGVCGMIGFGDNTTTIIVFAILEVIAVVGYWISEGGLDKVRAQELTVSIMTMIELIGGTANAEEEAQKAIDKAKQEVEKEDATKEETTSEWRQ